LETALFNVFGKITDIRDSIRIHTFEKHARCGAITLGDHHGVDGEGRNPDDSRYRLHLIHQVAVLAKVTRSFQDKNVGVDAEHLVSKLFAKSARHAHRGGETGHSESDTEHRKEGPHRNKGLLLRGHVATREVEGESHRPRM